MTALNDDGMSPEAEPGIERGLSTALARARILSQALADSARIARVSKRSRRLSSEGGFGARRGAKVLRRGVMISFVLMVAIPTLGAVIYYAFIASDQYVAEAKFTISGGLSPPPDSIGSVTGIPAIAIVQDTQIVVNYIHSRAAVEALQQRVNLRQRYAMPSVDWVSRFDPQKPIETLVSYWEKKSGASISMPAGIVTLKIWAFTPEDAAKIASAVLEICESLINDLNGRMNREAVANARRELETTFERLTKAEAALETARNSAGLLDVAKSAEALNKLMMDARASLLHLQEQYAADLRYVSAAAPQMQALKSRIDAKAAQISGLEANLTRLPSNDHGEATLAKSMTRFAELDLEREIAERLYSGAAGALEVARRAAERKLMYLNAFVRPVPPQEPQYPRRMLMIGLTAIMTLATWGLGCGFIVAIFNYKA